MAEIINVQSFIIIIIIAINAITAIIPIKLNLLNLLILKIILPFLHLRQLGFALIHGQTDGLSGLCVQL